MGFKKGLNIKQKEEERNRLTVQIFSIELGLFMTIRNNLICP